MTEPAASNGAVREPPRLDLIECVRAPAWARRLLRMQPWVLALMAFSIYFALPLVTAAASGVFMPSKRVKEQFASVGLGQIGAWLAGSDASLFVASELRGASYYATDWVHLGMSITTLGLGTFLMVTALQQFNGVFQYLATGGQLGLTEDDIAFEVNLAKRRCRQMPAYVVAAVAAVVLTSFMVSRAYDPGYEWWWGHRGHGLAGVSFALASGLMVVSGLLSVHLLVVGLRLMTALFQQPVGLRPFHPDGCNGFARFGDYLILLFCLSVTIAGAISITFLGGYLDVEGFLGTWLVGAAILAAIPIILITPLVYCTLQIGRAKQLRLSRIEACLDAALSEVENRLCAGASPADVRSTLEHVVHAKATVAAIYGPYNFPFKPRIVGALSLSYLVQVALLVHEAMTKLGAL